MSAAPQPAPGGRRRFGRRARRSGAVLILLTVMLLVGRGLGWLPGRGDGGPAADPDATPRAGEPRHEPSTSAAPATAASAGAAPGGEAAGPGGAAAAAEPPGRGDLPAAPAPALPASTPAVDDRRSARTAIASSAVAAGRLGAAFRAIDRLEADAADAAVAELRTRATQRLDQLTRAFDAHVRAGEVAAARALLELLLEPPAAPVAAALAALCAERGWPALSGDAVTMPAADAPPAPALVDRLVALPASRGLGDRARVIAQEQTQVTVRIVGADGVSFPSLPIWTVAPEGVTGDEAVALAWAAGVRGDGLGARVWCAVAIARGGADGEALAALRQHLR